MNIYLVSGNSDYQYVDEKHYNNLEILDDFLGKKSYKDIWKPLKIYLKKKDYNKNILLPFGDCIDFSNNLLILSEKAVELLREDLEQTGELLLLEVYNKSKLNYTKLKTKYFAYNCLNVLDTIDKNNSIVRAISDKTITAIDKYQFLYEKVKDQVIFKDNGTLKLAIKIYCTDKFLNKVIENGLTGFSFEYIWSSEGNPLIPKRIDT